MDRHVVLPEHDWSFDLGIGVAHSDAANGITGAGVNFEAAVSPVDRLEIGLRTGVRTDDDARLLKADAYGRLFDRQTFGTNNDVAANPELRIRGALERGRVVEVALEGRVFIPAEQYSELGVMFGLPLLFHLGHVARLDTGIYVPVIFYSPVVADVSVPVDLWFQATDKLWVGPMSGFVYHAPAGNARDHADVQFGLGFGYQPFSMFDLKAQFLFPGINDMQGAQNFGLGVGMQVRIE